MKELLFFEDKSQFQGKNYQFLFSVFIVIIVIISFLIIGYISSNIVLMRLGYYSIDLEQQKEQLLVRKHQLEYSVECLSSLTRIEKIASQELGMHRPEKIEFVAMLPAEMDRPVAASLPPEEQQVKRFIEAGTFLQNLVGLQILKNQ